MLIGILPHSKENVDAHIEGDSCPCPHIGELAAYGSTAFTTVEGLINQPMPRY